jgi:hypothetical protein
MKNCSGLLPMRAMPIAGWIRALTMEDVAVMAGS